MLLNTLEIEGFKHISKKDYEIDIPERYGLKYVKDGEQRVLTQVKREKRKGYSPLIMRDVGNNIKLLEQLKKEIDEEIYRQKTTLD